MHNSRSSPIYILALMALVVGLALVAAASVSGGALTQIDLTAQQQTIDAIVQTRLAATAEMQHQIEATGQAIETLNAQIEATGQAVGTLNAQMTLDSLATQAFEGMINTQVAAGAKATSQALFLTAVPNAVLHNADWTPVIKNIDGIDMVLVPAGCFEMGDPSDPNIGDGGQQCFTSSFYISRYEITNAEFAALGCTAAQSSNWTDPQRPRETVSWFEARDCAAKISGGRLPTEAEWEYAARGPDDLFYPWGNDWNPDNTVWSGNSNNQTANVGSKPGGASWVGANDLAGNVWEWVSSLYQPYPYQAADGREADTGNRTDVLRVLRGGSWDLNQDYARAVSRNGLYPYGRDDLFGFRVVVGGVPIKSS